jgi:hypothetical protein
MSSLKKEQINKSIAEFFVRNPNVQEVHYTPDGNCFESKSYADFHARQENFIASSAKRDSYEKEIEDFESEINKKAKAEKPKVKTESGKDESEKESGKGSDGKSKEAGEGEESVKAPTGKPEKKEAAKTASGKGSRK